MKTEISSTLAAFTAGLQCADIPDAVKDRAKLLMLDSIGIAIRSWHDVESTQVHLSALKALGLDHGACSVFGSSDPLSPGAAAELNGALLHSLDFDDTYAAGALHPSTTVLPAVLAAAQQEGAHGADMLAGLIGGFEAVCRLSVALGAADHYDRGFHPTATCGALASALAVSRVLKLDAKRTESALGIALSQTAGSLQFLANGAWTKRFQVGSAARAGVVSAYLAREGYVGPAQSLEGKHGFLRAYAPNPDAQRAVEGLGQDWRTLQIAVKPYPACRFAHAAVDALIDLRREHTLEWEQIEAVECGLPAKGILLVGDPIEEKRRVDTVVQGQFSMPFLAAAALMDGEVTWDSYARRLGDPDIQNLMNRVQVVQDAEVEALFPASFGARVTLLLQDGRRLERFVTLPKGEPDNFVTQDELMAKFMGLVSPYVDEHSRDAILQAIRNIEYADSVDALFSH